ncbi:MAG: hypothetical protein ACPGOY_18705, partial [Rhodospirillaceae bacterium]
AYAGTDIMVNLAGAGWQAGSGIQLKSGDADWTNFGSSHYYSGSANGYFYSDNSGAYKLVGSILFAPTYSAGDVLQFGATAWCEGSSWFSVNETYGQSASAARYGWSEIHVFELQAPTA